MNSRRLRSIARLTFGNPASLIYLALVAVAAAPALLSRSYEGGSNEWLLFSVTQPTLSVLWVSDIPGFEAIPSWFLYTSCALIQSLCLGALFQCMRACFQPHPRQPRGE
ncbi:SCO4225 family membrane protein [Streptomyces sioyaensis]|uniref:SCO4225 family membrane protein n=1 Tax=Streptomyces sioyaensis TaxID=67364 RepID=UPI003791446A